jgi:hypothetical protein
VTGTAPPRESLEEVAARIKRRLEEEQRASPVRKAPAAPVRAAAPARVTLVWRPTVIWPSWIIDGTPPPEPAAAADRVRLDWERPDR